MISPIDYNKLIQNNPKAFQFMEPFLGKYLATLPITEKFKVLDIGCFQGSNLLPFIELGCENIYGVDAARNPVALFADRIYKEYGVESSKSLKLRIDKVEEYDFPKSLDLILAFRVFQHLSKKDSLEVISKMQENTKKNGYNFLILWESGQKYDVNLGYFTQNEISSLYSNWEIFECEKKKDKGYNAIYLAAKKR